MNGQRNRRAHPRTACAIDVELRRDEIRWRGVIQDFSEGGLYVASKMIPDPGQVVHLVFGHPLRGEPVSVKAVVRRTVEAGVAGDGFGVELCVPLSRI